MKTSNDLTFVKNLRVAKFQLFLMTTLISFFSACNTEEIIPVSPDSQRNRVEASIESVTEEAELRVRPGGSADYHCQYLRDRVQGLLDEYKKDSTSTKRRDEILKELREIGEGWRAGGCQSAYGDITKLFPKKPLFPPKGAPTGGVILK